MRDVTGDDRRPTFHLAFGICLALLVAFAATSWLAVSTKSPTYDEPYHALSAWAQLRHHDFRLDDEDPPLWQYWASLPNGSNAIRADVGGDGWRAIARELNRQWGWCVDTLYRTPGNDAARFVGRCRAMMLALGVALGGLVGWWAWRVGGAVAAVAATGLYCLDPNFLGHAPLMKNDVAFTLAMAAFGYATWRVGRRVTIGRAAAVAVAAAAMLTTKFSGLAVAFLLPILLATRAVLPEPWPVLARPVVSRRGRFAVAATLVLFATVVGYAGIWAAYGFRYAPTPDAAVSLNRAEVADRARQNVATAESNEHPDRPPAAVPAVPPLAVRLALAADARHLVPQAYATGFLFTYTNNLVRPAFLCDRISLVGWWYYFPAAMAMKTASATLVAGVATAVVVARRVRRGGPVPWWTVAAVGVPVAAFMASAMRSNLNIGLRHVFPVYPFAFVAAGWAASRLWTWRGGRRFVAGLGLLLAAETAAAAPDFIAFFNAPARLAGDGGWRLLGDSNLDWGQDLTTLARWQRSTASADPLYLSYFGLADPASYGVHYIPIPGGYGFDRGRRFPDPYVTAWVAISTYNLQQAALADPTVRRFLDGWAVQRPAFVLGGTIRVYRLDPAARFGRAGR